MLSYWEQTSFTTYDFIIIGSGIVGLSTACSIAEKQADAKILVLERGIFPSGASTKNAGFACFAKACEMLADLEFQSEDMVVSLAYERYVGLKKLIERLGTDAIDYQNLGGYELLFEGENSAIDDKIEYLNGILKKAFNTEVFSLRNDRISTFGFSNIETLIYTSLEGQIDTGKMMQALLAKSRSFNIQIINGALVKYLDSDGNGVFCEVQHHFLKQSVTFKASKLAICSNAYASEFANEIDIQPGRGQVLVTEPIPNLKFKGTFHFDEGYYYFRNINNRVLFGGGRNLDFENERTKEFEYNQLVQSELDRYLQEIILPHTHYTVAMRWAGIMGFTSNKAPVVKQVKENIVLAFSCNGMGVALGSLSGEKAALLLLS